MTHVAPRTCSAVEGLPWFHKERLETVKVWLHVEAQCDHKVCRVKVMSVFAFSLTVAIFDL